MKELNILAEATIPYLKGNIEKMGHVAYLPSKEFTPETVKNADWLIIRSITKITPALLEGSRVKLITTATIGFDHIDTRYCEEHGIRWFNAPGCNAGGVGQYFGSYISLLALKGEIKPEEMTLGIVGAGNTGKEVTRYARALGMRVLHNDPPRAEKEGSAGFVTLDTLAREADLIEFHVPLTKEGPHATYHLLSDDFVQKLERKPIIANLCRGAVTDTRSLLKGLRAGKISRLVMDCWEGEPDISRELLAVSEIGTPHIAGFSAEGKRRGAYVCVKHGAEFFGLPMPEIEEPPAPSAPLIDLTAVHGRNQIYHALLHTFDPRHPDNLLRARTGEFEKLRKDYDYPREAPAFSVIGTSEEFGPVLRELGFRNL